MDKTYEKIRDLVRTNGEKGLLAETLYAGENVFSDVEHIIRHSVLPDYANKLIDEFHMGNPVDFFGLKLKKSEQTDLFLKCVKA